MEQSDIQKLAETIQGTTGSVNGRRSALREKNEKVMAKRLHENEEVKALKEYMQRKFKLDIFSKEFREKVETMNWRKLERKLAEADSSSSFVQFLRAGIQALTNNMYEVVQTSWEDWATSVSSSRDTELYAPNHGVSFPRQVGEQTPYPQVGVAALDIKLKNYKYGNMYVLTQELLDDDQTGSFARQAGLLGEYMKLLVEVGVYGKLASVANMQYIDFQIPVSETKPSYEANYPWTSSAAPFRGGGFNKPTSYGALNQTNIQNGIIALMNQKNLQGIKMQVNPTRLLISPQNSFDAAVLIHSSYYPSGAAAAGNTGGAFAINPLKSILDITVSRYMANYDGTFLGSSKAWYIVDDTKPWFIAQMREPVAVVQENPQAGQSFDLDVIRFKARSRQNWDFIDPRFAWQGNDGSV